MSDAPTPGVAARKGFVRAVIALVSGTALAHALTAAALPVLSRLYSPGDFGLLAVLSGATALVAVAAGLRYDIAVSIPEDDGDALHLLALAGLSAVGVSIAVGIVVIISPQWVTELLRQPDLTPYLWMLPLGVFCATVYSALQFWHGRHQRFPLLAKTRIAQAAVSSGTQIGLGWAAAGPVGLLSTLIINPGLAVASLGLPVLRQLRHLQRSRLRVLAQQYSRFPKYSSLEALANSAAIQLPVIMIAALAAPAEAGLLTMAMYAMQAPMALMGTAIGQVYVAGAPREHREGRLGAFTGEIIAGLTKAGIGPLLAAGILAPVLFSLVLGKPWERAGHMVAWMTPWFMFQFLAAPVSMALHVAGHQRRALILQLAGIAIRVGAVLAASRLNSSYLVEAFALSGLGFYALYLAVIVRSTQLPLATLTRALLKAVPPAAAWLAASAVLAYVLAQYAST